MDNSEKLQLCHRKQSITYCFLIMQHVFVDFLLFLPKISISIYFNLSVSNTMKKSLTLLEQLQNRKNRGKIFTNILYTCIWSINFLQGASWSWSYGSWI